MINTVNDGEAGTTELDSSVSGSAAFKGQATAPTLLESMVSWRAKTGPMRAYAESRGRCWRGGRLRIRDKWKEGRTSSVG
jgi:hypothetical protein